MTIDGQDFYEVRQQFNPGTDEAFYGLGQHQNGQMNYNGQDVELLNYNRVIAVPMLLSSKGYGLLWDNNSITRFGNPIPYDLASRDLKITGLDGQPGFTAKYYVGGQLAKLTRTEPDIDYRFLKDLPNMPKPSCRAPTASRWPTRRWSGKERVTTDKAGVHKFELYSSDYAKVWVDGEAGHRPLAAELEPLVPQLRRGPEPGQGPQGQASSGSRTAAISVCCTTDPLPTLDRHSLQLTSEVGKAIDYYYVGGDDMDEVVAGYRGLTGKAPMMPRWAYGFWQSRQRYETQDAARSGCSSEYRKRRPADRQHRAGLVLLARAHLGQPRVRRVALPRSQGDGRRGPRAERAATHDLGLAEILSDHGQRQGAGRQGLPVSTRNLEAGQQ